MTSSNSELEKVFNKHFTEFLKHIGLGSLIAHYMDNDDNFGERFRAAVLGSVEQEVVVARADENNACQNIIKSKWGTNDQLWDMQDRIKPK